MALTVSGLNRSLRGVDGEPDFSLCIPQLRFERGQIVFVMGHNGSGKSLLLRLLSGEVRPDNGHVLIQLANETWRADRRPSSVVRQEPEKSLAVDLTVKQNLILRIKPTCLLDYLFPARRLQDELKVRVKGYSDLHNKMDQPCRNLSAGQRQILAFLAIASAETPLLLLDEFLSATDADAKQRLRYLTRDQARSSGACVFIVSHDPRIALEDADRILVLNRGRLLQSITRNEADWNEHALVNLITADTTGNRG